MRVPGNFFLIGLMGAGKTTVGKAMARISAKTFYDTDHEIESRTGVRIPLIFEIEGERGFRQREVDAIRELTLLNDVVLATGGGAVLNEQNRHYLKSRGFNIYLRASADELYLRTRHDKNRPLLQIADPKAKLEQLYLERDPIYMEIADMVVDTGRQSVQSLAQQILSEVKHSNENS